MGRFGRRLWTLVRRSQVVKNSQRMSASFKVSSFKVLVLLVLTTYVCRELRLLMWRVPRATGAWVRHHHRLFHYQMDPPQQWRPWDQKVLSQNLQTTETRWAASSWATGFQRYFYFFLNRKLNIIFILFYRILKIYNCIKAWKSYARRKKLTKEIEENFRKLKFKPNQFTEFLTSIGFSEPENLTSRGKIDGQTSNKGFKTREVLLYSKPLNI